MFYRRISVVKSRRGIDAYLDLYHRDRPHQSLGNCSGVCRRKATQVFTRAGIDVIIS